MSRDRNRTSYAIGEIVTRFPSLAVEKEFSQAMKDGKTESLTDGEVLYKLLKANRYLANEICWVLTIQNTEVYLLLPRDPFALDQLIEAVKPGSREVDRDVVIGVRGPIASPEMCNGLLVPIVVFDKVYSFDIPEFIKAIPKPRKEMKEEVFRPAAEQLFYRIIQLADNLGADDEHRAVNYIACRYPRIYELGTEKLDDSSSLQAVQVIPSRLSGVRKLVDVIFSYVSRKTEIEEKYYVRLT